MGLEQAGPASDRMATTAHLHSPCKVWGVIRASQPGCIWLSPREVVTSRQLQRTVIWRTHTWS